MTVNFFTAPYNVVQIIMFLDDCYVPFSLRTTIVSSVLATCNSIGATFWCDTFLISSALGPEDTWMEV